jgi:hypothetical protein
VGPAERACSWFATEADRERAWWAHRAEMLTYMNPGCRPWGYWRYEARLDHAPVDHALYLAQHGLLTDDEEAAILTSANMDGAIGAATAAAAAVIRERRGIVLKVPPGARS